jgi:LmbE family N-acetylglucosaminyl deacetylase
MYTLDIPEGLRVLAISPHADDVELGAGAALLWLQNERKADIYYRVLSTEHAQASDGTVFSRASEARLAAAMLGVDVESELHYDAQCFIDAEFPEQRKAIHSYLERTKELIDPHLVISPSLRDMHQDHVTVAETVMRVFREGQALWHYEICQFNRSELFVRNLFIDVSHERYWPDTDKTMSYAERKNDIVQRSFLSQRGTIYLDEDVITGNMRLRGQQRARAAVKYSEAFQSRVSLFDYQGYKCGAVRKFAPKEQLSVHASRSAETNPFRCAA